MSKNTLSHLADDGRARMVDVGGKEKTRRAARAEAVVRLGERIARLMAETGGVSKGNVLETARIAGVMAAKRTADLVPMCHTLELDSIDLDVRLTGDAVVITAEARCEGRTGVEMEAMTAAAVAALTVYDMCKSAGKGIIIERVRLLEKSGGKSGTWRAGDQTETGG